MNPDNPNFRTIEQWEEICARHVAKIAKLKQENEELKELIHAEDGYIASQNDLVQKLSEAQDTLEEVHKTNKILEEELADAQGERDNYAQAMALALKEGIFSNKTYVKKEIESILSQVSTSENLTINHPAVLGVREAIRSWAEDEWDCPACSTIDADECVPCDCETIASVRKEKNEKLIKALANFEKMREGK